MTRTTASLFTGGGGFDVGAMMAGYVPVWGVEIRPDIAAVAERNIPGLRVIVSDVAAVDYASLPKVDHLHASPSCKNASGANSEGEESPEDLAAAEAICRALREVGPDTFTLENVWAYRDFEAFELVVGQLTRLGYKVDWWHLNASNYGVPQTRKRLILIARLDRQPRKPVPTHSKTPDPWGLYKPWVGWLEAIADLVDTLPDSEFAPWQISRLPTELKSMLLAQGGYLLSSQTSSDHKGNEYGLVRRPIEEPAFTITANSNQSGLRALLIPGDNASNGVVRQEDEPMVTVQSRGLGQCPHRAFLTSDNYGSPNDTGKERILQLYAPDDPAMTVRAQQKTTMRAFTGGRVVKMTPRALARFQSIPDSYLLPDANGLACEIIGNAVCPLLARAICESLEA